MAEKRYDRSMDDEELLLAFIEENGDECVRGHLRIKHSFVASDRKIRCRMCHRIVCEAWRKQQRNLRGATK